MGPTQLAQVLSAIPQSENPNLLVGFDTGDDAGVYLINDTTAIVQTMDFFTPIVDDPYIFGQIAAANALSDVYAMGGRPITAMNIVCFPINTAPAEILGQILRGGCDKTKESGAALVGGHSVDDPEPKFGMSVTGLINPNHIMTNSAAKEGDILILTKPIGTGIIATAAKFDDCAADVLEQACRSMTMLNKSASEIALANSVKAATDVTGFGLIGHAYRMASSSGVSMEIIAQDVPLLPGAYDLAKAGHTTNGGKMNRAFLGANLISDNIDSILLELLFDPQTSGGMLVCVLPQKVENVLSELRSQRSLASSVIGRVIPGEGKIRLL